MNRLIVSFSGGRTSAYMTNRILKEWRDDYDEINVLFANTGLEHEKTLEFVKKCDEQFGFNTVWLEAVTHEEMGKGQTHKIVTFDYCSINFNDTLEDTMTVSFHQIISIDIESYPDQHWLTLIFTDRHGKKDQIDVFCDSLSEEYGKDGSERKPTIFADLKGQLRRMIEES